ncbi:MAG: sulfurtransferase TusA family protein, partial [Helicobacter sp.]|nr:sulfurtransferase TusA family protein [Helicobacter sp.]
CRRIGEVAAFHLPRFVSEVLRLWVQNKPKYADFRAYLASGGEEEIIALTKKYKKVPNFKDDKNPYFDFSSDELFSLKGRGTGECSAGMYDLIEADKKTMLELVEAARNGQKVDYDAICLLACRMLLVARGQEARDKEGVHRAFKLHFIEAGLIDEKYLSVIKDSCDSSVLELADAVVALYATMDNSFNFQNKNIERVAKEENTGTSGSGAFADFRGVACPMNFVKTKMELSKLQSGELLEILLDDGAPIENVPASLKGEGHKILATTREGVHWRVKIQKA